MPPDARTAVTAGGAQMAPPAVTDLSCDPNTTSWVAFVIYIIAFCLASLSAHLLPDNGR